jgi:hypothetical protein
MSPVPQGVLRSSPPAARRDAVMQLTDLVLGFVEDRLGEGEGPDR